MKHKGPILGLWLSLLAQAAGAAQSTNYVPASVELPWVQREFRAVWIATVANLDWPSSPDLTVAQQQRELLAILDRAARLNLNAVIFQVSPCCDAMHSSLLEPWSYYLTGKMGRPPSPFYDPLRFAVEEAHQRGLELHAWFSPYRALHQSTKAPIAPNHISHTHPELVRQAGTVMWLDPGEPAAREFALNAVMDVVNGYDIDGVHFDDRLGYPEPDSGRNTDFPDEKTWRRYRSGGGQMQKDDWRRQNINLLVDRVYFSIKAAKPWVKFGISPAGIWQPGFPASVRGQNNYATLFTDSRKWLFEGSVDYLSPQLYWAIDSPEQRFPVLLQWWREQNPRHRNLWPGLTLEPLHDRWKASEIANQIGIVREQCDGAAGTVMFRARYLIEDRGGIASALSRVYAKPALVPPSPWLERGYPGRPRVEIEDDRRARWEPAGNESISLWIVQTRTSGEWQTRILPGTVRSVNLVVAPELLAVTAIDRCNVGSPPAIFQRRSEEVRVER